LLHQCFVIFNGLAIHTQRTKPLLVFCLSNVKLIDYCIFYNVNSEWMKAVVHIMATTGADWIKENPHGSYAPVREKTYAQW